MVIIMIEIKIVLGSTFTLGLLEDMTMPLHTEEATWSDVQSIAGVFLAMGAVELNRSFTALGRYVHVEGIIGEDVIEQSFQVYGRPVHVHFINAFGHASTCDLIESTEGIHIRDNRISLCLDEGWIIIIPQYRGERLPEGVIELPEGAELVPIKVVLSEDEEKVMMRKELNFYEQFLISEGYDLEEVRKSFH